jgi:hypothetical protein
MTPFWVKSLKFTVKTQDVEKTTPIKILATPLQFKHQILLEFYPQVQKAS